MLLIMVGLSAILRTGLSPAARLAARPALLATPRSRNLYMVATAEPAAESSTAGDDAMRAVLTESLKQHVLAVSKSNPDFAAWLAAEYNSSPAGVVKPTAASSTAPASARQPRMKVSALLAQGEAAIGQSIVLKGWVRTVRKQKTFSFVEVNDGSCMKSVQVVAPGEIESYAVAETLSTGAAVAVYGDVVASPAKGQAFEVKATKLELVGECDGAAYPIQKKKTSLEFLRSIAHLRARTNTLAAVARVRSTLAQATHEFFQGEGFRYVQTPLITASDCEGAGEMFRVTTLPAEPDEVPLTEDKKSVDFSQDFFGKPAYLTVSGQLSAETMACALGDVYTFGPTFRAEDSNTGRHLAEFWMIEPEMAFADLQDDMDNAEAFVKFAVAKALQECREDLEFFEKFYEEGLLAKLDNMVSGDFGRVRYEEAVGMVAAEIAKDPSKWEFPECKFGTDLATEHERWIAETAFGKPTFVYDYPREIKAFYMRDNEDGKTVAAMDLLVPGIGELIGGSQREERLEDLLRKMKEVDLEPEDYWWYLDLRRFGSVPHSGYGLGFERLVCFVTGMSNIRDAVAFPRFPGSCEF
eukprot:Transcript_14997.p1 GENE.Transcript_14997~~Transcript_14997.p1  ORF type:complete len:582 (-),score=276.45 Transcript_14997:123-1868(-)